MTGHSARLATLPGPLDDVAGTLALVSSGLFEDYLTYERPGTRWFAGNVRASVILERHHVRWNINGRTDSVCLGARPLRQLGDIVTTALPAGQRAFGYLTFEAAQLIHGDPSSRPKDRVLAHFIVPEIEVIWTRDSVTVRTGDSAQLELIVDLLVSATSPVSPPTTRIDITSPGERSRYERSVEKTLKEIQAEILHKVIISRRVEVPFPVDLPQSYAVGLAQNTPARSFLFQLDQRRCAGFSPETVAEISAAGEVLAQPLAGTRPLRHRPEEDRQLREELQWDMKECYEHVISARLADDEMRSVCMPDSVVIRDLLAVRERGTVQHLASTLAGRLRPELDAWDALEALFPAVTASGIPKRPALEVIAATENDERELYAGAVCMVDSAGALDSALVLRSIFQTMAGVTWLQAGAGIVAGSHPSSEYDETTNKLRSAAGCLVRAQGDSNSPGIYSERSVEQSSKG